MEFILKDPKFQKTLAQIAGQKGEDLEQVNIEAAEYLKELYTVHQPIAGLVAVQAAQYILARAYRKTIDVNPSELKSLTNLMRKHSVAFVMTHKTYIDMFVLGVVLARHGLPLPYTFAGINMDFVGLGQFARQCGCIFIRRSFKENAVYKATLRHFIATLVNEKSHFMWAIEGTRSRTGKLVWPKMGILKYIMEGEQEAEVDVKYVPVSIVYDLIPDVEEMTREGRGNRKTPESLGWFLGYLRKMGNNFGKISLRFGEPVDPTAHHFDLQAPQELPSKESIPPFAFELVHSINQITPVTTTSLICVSLLSKYALTKRAIESDVSTLMQLIETHQPDALVDRGKAIGESVQVALNLLSQAQIVHQQGESLRAKYAISTNHYLSANYYANMAIHHLFRRAFIELAFVHLIRTSPKNRLLTFWSRIMELRDLFKFEFFYSARADFTDEVEADLALFHPSWQDYLCQSSKDILVLLQQQKVLVSPAVLYTYVEAYLVVAQGLLNWDHNLAFEEERFLDHCLLLGGEMKWQGRIQRIESVSKPFLINGLRLARNRRLIPHYKDTRQEAITRFLTELRTLAQAINTLQEMTLSQPAENGSLVPLKRKIVPGSKTESITQSVLEGESGSHIGAFFDLDRTLIKGFSAKEFFQNRLLSGKMTPREVVAQFAGVFTYAAGNGNFAGLAAVGAQGVKDIKEQVFVEVGEEIYLKHLAGAIYPESRALVAAHLAKGHTVAIISAATPYQVNPVARDLNIDHVMCTRMEVKGGVFTGKIIEPACWGEGKSIAARQLAEKFDLDLQKSYFYTDSDADMPLLEIVGNPRPLNPNNKLSAIAFENDWPVYRFDDEARVGVTNVFRTFLAAGSLIPAVMSGLATGAVNLSHRDGVNSMMAAVGDLGTAVAGITLFVKGSEHLWSHRPAVFIFNHQSSADLLIACKLIRKDARGIAKKELQRTPVIGPLLSTSGAIFLDRSNREKAIEAMQPAVDALKSGTSIIIFPEGTRSYDYTLGKFKKGAFHLAMQAGVPLIPIVIKNAHDALPRGTALIRPAIVEVVVLPPVSTVGWKKQDLNEHIARIRGQFLKELGQEELKEI